MVHKPNFMSAEKDYWNMHKTLAFPETLLYTIHVMNEYHSQPVEKFRTL